MATEAQNPIRDFRFAVFGQEGQDLSTLTALIATGRKKFITLTKAEVGADAPESVSQFFTTVREKLQAKISPPVEEPGKGEKPGAKKPAAPALAKPGAKKVDEPPPQIDDAPAQGPDVYALLDGIIKTPQDFMQAFEAGLTFDAFIFLGAESALYESFRKLSLNPNYGLFTTVLIASPGETPAAQFDTIAKELYAIQYDQRVYQAWLKSTRLTPLPAAPPLDTRLYERLADSVPASTLSVPYLIHCMFEQVVRSLASPQEAETKHQEEEEAAIAALLDGAFEKIVPKSPLPESTPIRGEASVVEIAGADLSRPHIVRHFDYPERRFVAAGRPEPAHASKSVLEVERDLEGRFMLPGRDRRGMPEEPLKHENERGAERTELSHFARLPFPTLQRGRFQLNAQTVAGHAPTNDRIFSEELSAHEFVNVFTDALTSESKIRTEYVADDDALLVGLTTKIPKSRRRVREVEFVVPVEKGFSAWRAEHGETVSKYVEKEIKAAMPPPPPPAPVEEKKVEEPVKAAPGKAAPKKEATPAPAPVVEVKPVLPPPPAPEQSADQLPMAPPYMYKSKSALPDIKQRVLFPFDGAIVRTFSGESGMRAVVTLDGLTFGLRQEQETRFFQASFSDNFASTCVTQIARNDGSLELTLSLPSGLVVEHSTAGFVSLSYADKKSREDAGASAKDEISRRIVGKGTVVRNMADGRTVLLLPNGNTAEHRTDGTWIVTNNDGIRTGTSATGEDVPVPFVSSASTTDPETGTVVITRQDMTMVIRRVDGSTAVHHPDGTVITTGSGKITISCPGYPQVAVEPHVKRLHTSCPGGVYVDSYPTWVALTAADGSSIRAFGSNVICESNRLHVTGLPFGDAMPPALPGAYTCDLDSGRILVEDASTNRFFVNGDGSTKVMLAGAVHHASQRMDELDHLAGTRTDAPPEHNEDGDEEDEEDEEDQEEVGEPESEDEEEEEEQAPADENEVSNMAIAKPIQRRKPSVPSSHPPRFFAVREDGSATQYLLESDVSPYIARMQENSATTILTERVPGDESAESLTFLTRLTSSKSGMNDESLPSVAQVGKSAQPKKKEQPVLMFRQLIRAPQLTNEEEELLYQDLAALETYRKQREKFSNALVVEDDKSNEDIALAQRLQERYIQQRAGRTERQELATLERMDEMDASERENSRPHTRQSSKTGGTPSQRGDRTLDEFDSSIYDPLPAPGHTLPHAYNAHLTPTRKNYFETQGGMEFLKTDVTMGASAKGLDNTRTRVLKTTMATVLPPKPSTGLSASQRSLETLKRVSMPRNKVTHPAAALNESMSGTRDIGGAKHARNERFLAVDGPIQRQVKTASTTKLVQKAASRSAEYVPTIEVSPGTIDFGVLPTGDTYMLTFTARNIGHDMLRFRVKQPLSEVFRVGFTPKPLAPGMVVTFKVECDSRETGDMQDEIVLITEKDVVAIPVFASFASATEEPSPNAKRVPGPSMRTGKLDESVDVGVAGLDDDDDTETRLLSAMRQQ